MKTFVLNGWSASPDAWKLCTFPIDRLLSYREQLDGVPEKVLETVDEVLLVGWSMGTSTALRLWMAYPEKVKGIVLLAAMPRMLSDTNWVGISPRRLDALYQATVMTHGEGFFGPPPGAPNPYSTDTEENLRAGIRYLAETDLRASLEAFVPQVASDFPLYLFHSERDGIVRSAQSTYLKGLFLSAQVTFIPGTEHALPVIIPREIDAAVGEIQKKCLEKGRR